MFFESLHSYVIHSEFLGRNFLPVYFPFAFQMKRTTEVDLVGIENPSIKTGWPWLSHYVENDREDGETKGRYVYIYTYLFLPPHTWRMLDRDVMQYRKKIPRLLANRKIWKTMRFLSLTSSVISGDFSPRQIMILDRLSRHSVS